MRRHSGRSIRARLVRRARTRTSRDRPTRPGSRCVDTSQPRHNMRRTCPWARPASRRILVPTEKGDTMFRHIRRALACAATRGPRRAGRRAGRRLERLERDRAEPCDHAQADGSRPDARHRDGAGRRLRRGQRIDRDTSRTLPEPVGAPVRSRRLGGCGDRDRRAPRARGDRSPAQVAGPRRGLRGDARAIPDGRSKDEGVRVGAAAATAMLAARANDGFMASTSPSIGPDPATGDR